MPTTMEPSLEEQLSGTWQTDDADVVLKFNSLPPGAGSRSLTVDLAATGAFGLPATFSAQSDNNLRIEVEAVAATFSGTYNNGRLNGRWRRSGAETDLLLSRRSTSTSIAMNDNVFAALQGTWAGTLQHEDGTHLRVNIHLEGAPQHVDVVAESVDQNAAAIPAFAVTQYGDEIEIFFLMAAAPNGRFRGRLNGTLAGAWHQNERTVDAIFHKVQVM